MVFSPEKWISTLAINSCLDKAILDHIEIYTIIFIGDNGNTKDLKLDDMINIFVEEMRLDRDKNLPKVTININDINIRVTYDESYNSDHMTGTMA